MRASLARMVRSMSLILSISVPLANAAPTESDLPWVPAESVKLVDTSGYALQFLGAGGVMLKGGRSDVLVDPFFSNPGVWDVMRFATLQSDTKTIDTYLPDISRVGALLVGHGHYDHAMDIPAIAGRLPASSWIFVSRSAVNMMASALPADRTIDAESLAASQGAGGQWLSAGPHLRVLPIRSEHSPHFASVVIAGGKVKDALGRLPSSAFGWKAGTTLSYLVDFLNGQGEVEHRAFIQTSASSPPYGLPPQDKLQDGHPVDVAILCAANFNHSKDYPEGILRRLQPRQIVFVHWERFWDPYVPNQAVPLPGLKLDELVARAKAVLPGVPISIPQRGAIVPF